MEFLEPFFVTASAAIPPVKKQPLPVKVKKIISNGFYPHPEFPSKNLIDLFIAEKPGVLSHCQGHSEDVSIEGPLADASADGRFVERAFRGEKVKQTRRLAAEHFLSAKDPQGAELRQALCASTIRTQTFRITSMIANSFLFLSGGSQKKPPSKYLGS